MKWTTDNKIPDSFEPIPLNMGSRYKRYSNGSITQFKVRCAANGDKNISHVYLDPEKTTTHKAENTTASLLFALAVSHRLHIEHMDIEAACLYGHFAHNGANAVNIRQHPRFKGSYKHLCLAGRLAKINGTPYASHNYLEPFSTLKKITTSTSLRS